MVSLVKLWTESGKYDEFPRRLSLGQGKATGKKLRHLSKNLEQAEKTIQELRRSLKVSQNEKLKFQQNLKRSLGKSQKLDELLKELKSFSEHESRSTDQHL